jgi:hypothetical protein
MSAGSIGMPMVLLFHISGFNFRNALSKCGLIILLNALGAFACALFSNF